MQAMAAKAPAANRPDTPTRDGAAFAARSLYVSDPSADQPSEVAYWHRLAVKRLRLLGARERRIVKLLRRLHGQLDHRRHQRGLHRGNRGPSVQGVICRVFVGHCSEALNVARCESNFNVYARNGQYLGLFQMGEFARAKYGHSWNAWGQSRSAYRYFLDAGWSPWACRP